MDGLAAMSDPGPACGREEMVKLDILTMPDPVDVTAGKREAHRLSIVTGSQADRGA